MKAQATALHPFVPAGADAMPALGQALLQAGYDPRKVKPLGTGVWNDNAMAQIPAIAGGWFASPDTAGFNAFAARYQQRFNAAPTRTATLAYDAVSLAAALPHIQSGRLRALTVFDTKRYAKLPDAITARLNAEIVRIINSAEVQQVLGDNGLESITNTPADFAVMIKEDARIWDATAASAGLISPQ